MSSQDLSNTTSNTTSQTSSTSTEPEGGYPPQLHAGKVGYGPEFGKGVSTGTKVSGLKEEVMGKVKHDPSLVQHGHDMRTGQLARKEREEADKDLFPDEGAQSGDAPTPSKPSNVDAGRDQPAAAQDKFDQERSSTVEADRDAVPERDQHARENVRMV
ncbi:unnamed protein product [Peniophora sp. CBMAI 1063]|nr:unnamed protein product [Peniophora sp. CBMAI 1063]